MNMGFDYEARMPGRSAAVEPAVADGGIDWHGLRARFLAMHAYRSGQTHSSGDFAGAAQGSFHRTAADSLAAYVGASPAVNPNDLADGKSLTGKWGTSPGQPHLVIEGNDD